MDIPGWFLVVAVAELIGIGQGRNYVEYPDEKNDKEPAAIPAPPSCVDCPDAGGWGADRRIDPRLGVMPHRLFK